MDVNPIFGGGGGSTFENSLKRRIYVFAAVKDSEECRNLRRRLERMTRVLEEDECYMVCNSCGFVKEESTLENQFDFSTCVSCQKDVCVGCPDTIRCRNCFRMMRKDCPYIKGWKEGKVVCACGVNLKDCYEN